MRKLLILAFAATLGYAMTGLIYFEGRFDGALVVKPWPMLSVAFGGGEEGTWKRHHAGQPLPWYIKREFVVISRFDWEYGMPTWVTAYVLGYLVTILLWPTVAVVGAMRLLRIRSAKSGKAV